MVAFVAINLCLLVEDVEDEVWPNGTQLDAGLDDGSSGPVRHDREALPEIPAQQHDHPANGYSRAHNDRYMSDQNKAAPIWPDYNFSTFPPLKVFRFYFPLHLRSFIKT